jgi:hypothetical protein
LEDEMDWLTRLSGSQVPNAFAVVCLVALTVAAFVLRERGSGAGFTLMTLAFGAAVGAKNAVYNVIVSQPHGERSVAAHHDYARALLYVAIAQIGIALIVGLITVGAQRLRWLAALAVLACGFAANSMLNWRSVYLHQDPNGTVHYEMSAPWLQWVLLAGLVITGVMTVVSLARRPRPRH